MKGYRTITFNLVASLPLIMEAMVQTFSLPEVLAIIPADKVELYALGMAVANIWLRALTTTPVGQK